MAEIILTFDGPNVIKETKGFKGKDCVTKTAWVEKALGKEGERTMKTGGSYEDGKRKQKDRYQN